MDDLAAKIESEMTDAGRADWGQPKQAKGGVFAPADIGIIKSALIMYAQNSELSREQESHVMSLMHRLNRI
jgi:hypothetical protein